MSDTINTYSFLYNGWSNYATWRINLEILDNIEWNEEDLAILSPEMLEEYVENAVFEQYSGNMGMNHYQNHLVEDYARAFLNDVSYEEIYESIKENLE
tara:strand:- start:3822 stop:4115 length:294 start_codon:yes stop_codon:yes gene_type:complete